MLKAKSKVYRVGDDRLAIYLPKSLHQDSQFPLKADDEVEITVDKDKVVVELA